MYALLYEINQTEAAALAFDEVSKARALSCGEYTILAVQVKNVFSRSARAELKAKITAAAAAALGTSPENIVVTFDMEVFRKLNDGEDAETLLELAKSRQ